MKIEIPDHYIGPFLSLLDDYMDVLSNNGCNSTDWPANWSHEQRSTFIRDSAFLNYGKMPEEGTDEYDDLLSDLRDLHCPMDTVWLGHLKAALQNALPRGKK